MKVQELLDYISMSSHIANEILQSEPDHGEAEEVRQLLAESQDRVRAALSSAAAALERASTVFEQYDLKSQVEIR